MDPAASDKIKKAALRESLKGGSLLERFIQIRNRAIDAIRTGGLVDRIKAGMLREVFIVYGTSIPPLGGSKRLLEDGSFRLLEDGSFRLLQ